MSEPDADVLNHIEGLVAEEHELRESGGADRSRLTEVEEQLDRCWDLLRQRRARREFDQDPDESALRSSNTVEHYLQ